MGEDVTRHRYPLQALFGDYARAGFGLALCLAPLLLIDLAGPMVALFAALSALFAWFGLRTGLRQMSWIELSPEAIEQCGPQPRRLDWPELETVRLAYYAPRRQRDQGWLQLSLRGHGRSAIRVDSTIEGFDEVLRRTQAVVDAKGIELDPTTAGNFAALGLAGEGRETAQPMRTATFSSSPASRL
jgi:hypothetical protein